MARPKRPDSVPETALPSPAATGPDTGLQAGGAPPEAPLFDPPRCGSCRFYVDEEEDRNDRGICHWNPSKVMKLVQDWCGRHKER